MDSTKPSAGRRVLTGLVRAVVALLLVGLLGTVAWLISERNARTFTLRVENGKLVVLKGRMLPIGADPWTPGDPLLADAYAPIPLEGMRVPPTLLEARFDDRDELDRALFQVLEELARPRIQSQSEEALEEGLYYLRRAQRLTGLSQEQRLTLEQMQADVAFYQAKLKLEQARRMVTEALAQLEMAATNEGPNARRAQQMASAVIGPARALEQALREATRGVLEPAPPPSPRAPETVPVPEAAPAAPAPEPAPDPGAAGGFIQPQQGLQPIAPPPSP